MMERSTKFLSLTGLSGIMAGVYALAGAYIAYKVFHLHAGVLNYPGQGSEMIRGSLILLALTVLILAIGTAVILSWKRSGKTGEKLWNSAARRMLINMAIPLVTGGIFILILISKGLFILSIPITLIFYGLALINASKFTFEDFKYLGILQVLLGLLATYFIGYALVFWAIGFGLMHILYGIYMYLKYER